MFRRIVLALVFTVSIPVAAFVVAHWILYDLNSHLGGQATVQELCALKEVMQNAELRAACAEVGDVQLLRTASVWSGAIAVGLLLIYGAMARICGSNRKLNAAIFPVLIPVSIIVIAALMLVEGIILTYAAWVGESYAFGVVHPAIIFGIGLGAAIGALKLVGAVFSLRTSLQQNKLAKQLSEKDFPHLWKFVGEIAEKLKAKRPDNIIVGLEPTFFATAAETVLVNEEKTLRGETLYLSLPLMRLFSVDELRAVIGHELGHFKGQDTAYSLKFAPVYAGLSNSISRLSGDESGASIAGLPALAMLSVMLDLFSINESRISRQRELEADKAGVSVSSPRALATALGKVVIYSSVWDKIRAENVKRLNDGKFAANLSLIFEDSAKYDVSHRALGDVMEEILQARISHPTDTHPTISERFKGIRFADEQLSIDDLIKVGSSGSTLIGKCEEIEQDLTLFEHRLMVSIGAVQLPAEKTENGQSTEEGDRGIRHAVYSLAAAMVGCDGRIDQSEIQTAEAIGKRLLRYFDSVEFRAYCRSLEEIPDYKIVVDQLEIALNADSKNLVYQYMDAIANADNELADEEKELLSYMKKAWHIDDDR